MNQQENFSQANLAQYDSALWLNAFAGFVSQSTSLMGLLYTPSTVPKTSSVASYGMPAGGATGAPFG